MRFFLALEIPEESKQELSDTQNRLKQLIPDLRLSQSEKLHLTIAFIGEQEDSLRDDLKTIMIKAVQGIAPFTVTPAYIDGFPNFHHPSTIWCGVKGEIDKLMILRERVKDGLKSLQITVDERRYTPHIKLANHSGEPISKEVENRVQQMMLISVFKSIPVKTLKLFESTPDEGFHKHNTLEEIQLR